MNSLEDRRVAFHQYLQIVREQLQLEIEPIIQSTDRNCPKYLMKYNQQEYSRRLSIVKKRLQETIKEAKLERSQDSMVSFKLQPEHLVEDCPNLTTTPMNYSIVKFMKHRKLDSDCVSSGWMRMHDLKGWMKLHDLKGWMKQKSSSFVKFLYYRVIGTMMLHDLTGWLKECIFQHLNYGVIGTMKLHDLTGWLKEYIHVIAFVQRWWIICTMIGNGNKLFLRHKSQNQCCPALLLFWI